MERHMTIRRGFPIAFLVFALAMAVPVAALLLRGVTSVMTMLGIVMEFDAVTAVFFSALLLPRIIGSLWAYFKVDNMWGNEVGYMAFFLWFPIIAAIFYALTVQKLKRPPRGYEWATIKDGIVHQPIYEYVGPPQPTTPQAAPQVPLTQDHPPGPPPAYSPEYPPQRTPYLQQRPGHPLQVPPYQGDPQPGYPQPGYPQPGYPQPGYPQPGYPQPGYPQPGYPQPGHPQPGHPQPGYPQPGYPQPGHQPPGYQPPQQSGYPHPGYQQAGYQQQPYPPPQGAQNVYGQQPYGGLNPPPTAFPQAYAPYAYQAPQPQVYGPGPEWRKVGESMVQKRDYLAWHNVVLLIMNAMMLASFILGLIIYPFIFSLDGFDESAIVEIPTNATFVLFTLIIQDGILIWMVWHQVVQRRVIPLSEMGISRSILGDSSKMARYTAWGIGFGLVFFALALLIELGQTAIGFVPPDDAIVIGPEAGDLGSYLTWLISACIIAPISEEFFFRGYAFYAFNKRYGLGIALFVSALGFSAIHGSIYALLPIFVAGIGLALAYHWTGSLVPPMVAHAVNNFIAVTLMYTGFYG